MPDPKRPSLCPTCNRPKPYRRAARCRECWTKSNIDPLSCGRREGQGTLSLRVERRKAQGPGQGYNPRLQRREATKHTQEPVQAQGTVQAILAAKEAAEANA